MICLLIASFPPWQPHNGGRCVMFTAGSLGPIPGPVCSRHEMSIGCRNDGWLCPQGCSNRHPLRLLAPSLVPHPLQPSLHSLTDDFLQRTALSLPCPCTKSFSRSPLALKPSPKAFKALGILPQSLLPACSPLHDAGSNITLLLHLAEKV